MFDFSTFTVCLCTDRRPEEDSLLRVGPGRPGCRLKRLTGPPAGQKGRPGLDRPLGPVQISRIRLSVGQPANASLALITRGAFANRLPTYWHLSLRFVKFGYQLGLSNRARRHRLRSSESKFYQSLKSAEQNWYNQSFAGKAVTSAMFDLIRTLRILVRESELTTKKMLPQCQSRLSTSTGMT